MIPYGKQDITEEDIAEILKALQSDFITQGPAAVRFEQALQEQCCAKHAIAVNSATSALHVACLSLGLRKGDTVWTSPITFVASANCAIYCGATVDFVDIDDETYNMCPKKLEAKLKDTKALGGQLPKVIIPVHMAGQSCNMEAIHALSMEYGFHIIEDASHAIGAKYQNQSIGSCRYSDITVFSFHPVKIVTTAEGGAALTNNPQLAQTMQLLRSHGVTRNPDLMTHKSDGAWYYQQIMLGFNYRMTDIQAALGCSQLSRLETYVNQRHSLARQYNELLSNLPLRLPYQHPDTYSSFHLYIIRLDLQNIPVTQAKAFDALRQAGIGVNLHYIPVHTQPFYQKMGFKRGDFPIAEQYYKEAISLPLYPKLKNEEQLYIVDELKRILLP